MGFKVLSHQWNSKGEKKATNLPIPSRKESHQPAQSEERCQAGPKPCSAALPTPARWTKGQGCWSAKLHIARPLFQRKDLVAWISLLRVYVFYIGIQWGYVCGTISLRIIAASQLLIPRHRSDSLRSGSCLGASQPKGIFRLQVPSLVFDGPKAKWIQAHSNHVCSNSSPKKYKTNDFWGFVNRWSGAVLKISSALFLPPRQPIAGRKRAHNFHWGMGTA